MVRTVGNASGRNSAADKVEVPSVTDCTVYDSIAYKMAIQPDAATMTTFTSTVTDLDGETKTCVVRVKEDGVVEELIERVWVLVPLL